MTQAGPKLGWTLGGIGGLIWLPLLAAVWLAQGKIVGALCGLGVFAAGCAYVLLVTPWRFHRTPIRTLYLGILAFMLVGAVVTVWQFYQPGLLKPGDTSLLLVFLPLLIPVGTLGRKTWSQLHPQGP